MYIPEAAFSSVVCPLRAFAPLVGYETILCVWGGGRAHTTACTPGWWSLQRCLPHCQPRTDCCMSWTRTTSCRMCSCPCIPLGRSCRTCTLSAHVPSLLLSHLSLPPLSLPAPFSSYHAAATSSLAIAHHCKFPPLFVLYPTSPVLQKRVEPLILAPCPRRPVCPHSHRMGGHVVDIPRDPLHRPRHAPGAAVSSHWQFEVQAKPTQRTLLAVFTYVECARVLCASSQQPRPHTTLPFLFVSTPSKSPSHLFLFLGLGFPFIHGCAVYNLQ